MTKITVFIWHKLTGEIVAVGRPTGAAKCVPLSSENQLVLETEVEEKHVAELHRTHIVDVRQRALARIAE